MKSSSRHNTCIIAALSILCTVLALALVFLLWRGHYFAIFKQTVNPSSYDYRSNAQYIQRETLFESLPDTDADIVFVGDSITARCEWQELFPDRRVLNRGIDSDVTEGVLNRLDVIIAAHPKQIFLMIGINDIRQQIPPEATLSNYKRILEELSTALPDTELYVQSVLPVGASTGITAESVMELNEKLSRLASSGSARYIDLYSLLSDSDSGCLPTEYSIDGVHLTGTGYQIWKDALLPYIDAAP